MLIKYSLRNSLFLFCKSQPKFLLSSTTPPSNPTSSNPEINNLLTKVNANLVSGTPYIHKLNYNFEEHKNYTKNVKNAIIAASDRQKISESKATQGSRRNRRVYDRPKHDLDLTNYDVWRVFDRIIPKFADESHPLACKFIVAPALMRKVFGRGRPSLRTKYASCEYDFEDNDLSRFLLYDYEWQKTRRPNSKKRVNEQEFWESEESHTFRVISSRYADFRKFKKWLRCEIEKKKDGPSFEENFLKKYGEIETYDDYDKKYEVNLEATVRKYDWNFYLEKNEKLEISQDYPFTYSPAKTLDEKYRLPKPDDVKVFRVIQLAKETQKSDMTEKKSDDGASVQKKGKGEKKAKGEQKEKLKANEPKEKENVKEKTKTNEIKEKTKKDENIKEKNVMEKEENNIEKTNPKEQKEKKEKKQKNNLVKDEKTNEKPKE